MKGEVQVCLLLKDAHTHFSARIYVRLKPIIYL